MVTFTNCFGEAWTVPLSSKLGPNKTVRPDPGLCFVANVIVLGTFQVIPSRLEADTEIMTDCDESHSDTEVSSVIYDSRSVLE